MVAIPLLSVSVLPSLLGSSLMSMPTMTVAMASMSTVSMVVGWDLTPAAV